MPGVHALSEELGVHHTTAAEALSQLEREGFLKGGGAGKKREILSPKNSDGIRLRVGILLYEAEDIGTEVINELLHRLNLVGHDPVVAGKSLVEIRFEVKRLGTVLREKRADVWIVLAGSLEVQEWFVERDIPIFALFGYNKVEGVTHTSPVKSPLIREIVQRLVSLKHKRIVLLIAEQLRKDSPVTLVKTFLDELELHGLSAGTYNLPEWNHEKGSLQICLKASFHVTPPTALIVDDPQLMPAVLQFLNQRKLVVPDDVSLICLDGDSSFKWMEPALSRLEADIEVSIRQAVRWVNRVAKGKDKPRKYMTKVKFIEGGTMGKAPH